MQQAKELLNLYKKALETGCVAHESILSIQQQLSNDITAARIMGNPTAELENLLDYVEPLKTYAR